MPHGNPPRVAHDPVEGNSKAPSVTPSLLLRLRARDGTAWQQLVTLYAPEVYAWARKAGLAPEDAADVQQEVFGAVAQSLDRFRRERPGDSFRGWLYGITRFKIRDVWRRRHGQPQARGGTTAQERLQAVPTDESIDAATGIHSAGDASGVLRRALEILRTEFAEHTWQAFWRIAVEGQSAADVATALGMSLGAVYVAKSRVLHRLREEFGGLLDGLP